MEFGTKNIIFIILFVSALSFFTWNIVKLFSYLKFAKPDEKRFKDIPKRITRTLVIAFGQSKIFRDKYAALVHVTIFWGFLVLLFSALNSMISGLFGVREFFNILGPVYSVITVLTDIFCVAIILAVFYGAYRRLIQKVKRLQREGDKFEAVFILGMILTIVTSLLFENATSTILYEPGWAIRPISSYIATFISPDSAMMIHEIAFWVHIVFILSFLNFLPYGKHLHVVTAIPNVFFSNDIKNTLDPIDFEDETIEQYGVADVEDHKWKTLLDGYTCTHCGRCTSVCPANQTGKILDPREVIIQVRERTKDKMPILAKIERGEEITEEEQAILDKKYIGNYQSMEALWQCTTCGACMQECPVNIEHVPAIIEMRQNMVMMESEFPEELQNTFGNLEANATPWGGFSQSERADWTEGTGVQTAAENPDFDVLYFVGCAASYDDRAKKVAIAFCKLMQLAGVNFAILGTEERCNGDVARRSGNEYLADMLIQTNIETFSKYNVKKIVTACPHGFNIIKNEYPQFGGNYDIVHHSQFIMDLIKQGKLSPSDDSKAIEEFTYHDSCYMGRYNGVYDEPRDVLKSVPGLHITEVPKSRDKGMCCGAGGGLMFVEERKGKKVNIARTEQLLESGAKTIALNCPFCLTMITDGVKAKERDDVQVKDIAEVLLEHIEA